MLDERETVFALLLSSSSRREAVACIWRDGACACLGGADLEVAGVFGGGGGVGGVWFVVVLVLLLLLLLGFFGLGGGGGGVCCWEERTLCWCWGGRNDTDGDEGGAEY